MNRAVDVLSEGRTGKRTLLLRADASVEIGTGHVMRCFALAQAWQDAGGRAMFASARMTPALRKKLLSEGMEIVDLEQHGGTAAEIDCIASFGVNAQWVVCDGYQLDCEYHRGLRQRGFRVLAVDDYGQCEHYAADLILNQNIHARESLYTSRESYTQLLIGPRYAMLRREFAKWRDWKREIPAKANRVLVTMGGSDPHNVTARIIALLLEIEEPELQFTVLGGGSNRNLRGLESLIANDSRFSLIADAADMAEQMAKSDLAISAAGTTCWEMCLLGLPMLLVDLAENQKPIAKALHKEGAAVYVGSGETVSPEEITNEMAQILSSAERRRVMSERSRGLVDGFGAQRVVASLTAVRLRLRPVERDDRKLLWEWANDPEVRSAAFSTAAIPWDDHCNWLDRKLQELGTAIFIAMDDGAAIGQIRMERMHNSEVQIGLSIAREKRGSGLAAPVIAAAARIAFEDLQLTRLHAFIKCENTRSLRAFEAAGFRQVETLMWRGHDAHHYRLDRDPDSYPRRDC
jgi:UDP-2,4-diacetamido-2,4,6-trideoxy-beta-L-altropyranose hydrolase